MKRNDHRDGHHDVRWIGHGELDRDDKRDGVVDGVEEDDADYSGSGDFTKNAFDSTTYTDHDGSDTTTDAAGKLNGTESQNDYELHTSNETRQDVDSVQHPAMTSPTLIQIRITVQRPNRSTS